MAYLSGPAGSGRETAALVGLAELHSADRIAQLYLDGNEPLHTYFSDPALLRPDHGHILEAEPLPSDLAQLSQLARAAPSPEEGAGDGIRGRRLAQQYRKRAGVDEA